MSDRQNNRIETQSIFALFRRTQGEGIKCRDVMKALDMALIEALDPEEANRFGTLIHRKLDALVGESDKRKAERGGPKQPRTGKGSDRPRRGGRGRREKRGSRTA